MTEKAEIGSSMYTPSKPKVVYEGLFNSDTISVWFPEGIPEFIENDKEYTVTISEHAN